MVLQQSKHYLSEQEYLQSERIAEIRHEYIDGEVYAMAGTSRNHQRLVGNVHTALNVFLANKPCEPFASEIKVKADRCFFYPDIVVVCRNEQGDDYFTEQPTLIIEVLSKSTRRMDKTIKLAAYKSLPSLLEYVLIEQDHVEIEVMRRSQNWFPAHYFLGDQVLLEAVGLTVDVAELYHRVDNEDMRDFLQLQQQQAG